MGIPDLTLNSGYKMPQVGFGLWKVGNDVAADTVYNAIKAGYRLFDGACDYGNEKECGEGVARAIKDGIVKREELFIVSKLWNTFHDGYRVEPIVRKQLADWGLEYFDLYLIHFPVALEYVDPSVHYPPGWHVDDAGTTIRTSKASIQETWQAMESLVYKGLSRSIGVSNFQSQLLYDLLRYAKIRPATLQVELHPYLTQADLIKLTRQEGIALTAYSSFGPSSFLEFHMKHADALTPLLVDPKVKEIADKYGKTNAQVLLRWATQQGLAVIHKTTRVEQLTSNLDCVDWNLEEADLAAISAFNQGIRFNQPSNYFPTELLWIFG